jgi:hypothetical protein
VNPIMDGREVEVVVTAGSVLEAEGGVLDEVGVMVAVGDGVMDNWVGIGDVTVDVGIG